MSQRIAPDAAGMILFFNFDAVPLPATVFLEQGRPVLPGDGVCAGGRGISWKHSPHGAFLSYVSLFPSTCGSTVRISSAASEISFLIADVFSISAVACVVLSASVLPEHVAEDLPNENIRGDIRANLPRSVA